MDAHPDLAPTRGQVETSTRASSLGLLDAGHMAVFRRALDVTLHTEAAETALAEIADGLPTRESWLEFDVRREGHPVDEPRHDELCAGSREKARKFRDGFDVYVLTFPATALRGFQIASPGTKAYLLSFVELLARSCHQMAALLFDLDGGVHKRSVYEDWRDAPVDHLPDDRQRLSRPPSAFFHSNYLFHEQYPQGIADVVGYWAEAKIFGGVMVFDRGPTATERRELYLHAGLVEGPSTLFPPTPDQSASLADFLLQGQQGAPQQPPEACPLPIRVTMLNGYRYHPEDAMTRFNVFRDRYERVEPPARSVIMNRRWLNGRNWPELAYEFRFLDLMADRAAGREVDEAELAAVREGLRRISPSSPSWPPINIEL